MYSCFLIPLPSPSPSGRPVIACSSGGPLESIQDQVTGFLCDPTAASFADAYQRVFSMSVAQYNTMQQHCRDNVVSKFSLAAFSDQLETCVRETVCEVHSDTMRVREWRQAAHVLGSTPRARLVGLLNIIIILIMVFLALFYKLVN